VTSRDTGRTKRFVALRIAHHAVVLHVGKVVANDAASVVAADENLRQYYLGLWSDDRSSLAHCHDVLATHQRRHLRNVALSSCSLAFYWRTQLRPGRDADVRDVRRLRAVVVPLRLLACVVACVIVGLLIGGLTNVSSFEVSTETGDQSNRGWSVPDLLEAVAAAICRRSAKSADSILIQGLQLAGKPLALSPFTVYEIVTALIVMTAVAVLFRFTNLGCNCALGRGAEVSRLLGVRVGRLLTLVGCFRRSWVSSHDPRRINLFQGLTRR